MRRAARLRPNAAAPTPRRIGCERVTRPPHQRRTKRFLWVPAKASRERQKVKDDRCPGQCERELPGAARVCHRCAAIRIIANPQTTVRHVRGPRVQREEEQQPGWHLCRNRSAHERKEVIRPYRPPEASRNWRRLAAGTFTDGTRLELRCMTALRRLELLGTRESLLRRVDAAVVRKGPLSSWRPLGLLPTSAPRPY